MSGPINTGGPAFPHITESGKYVYEEGMTLRDYFAAKAMQGDWAAQGPAVGLFTGATDDQLLADSANLYYRMADAMLKAREA